MSLFDGLQMCECIVRELSDLNPGAAIDEWEPDSSKSASSRRVRLRAQPFAHVPVLCTVRQLVVLMSNALKALPRFRDGIYRLPKTSFGDFVFGASRYIEFDALRSAQLGAHDIAVAISSSMAWVAMLRDRELPLVEALRRAAGER